jgi:hypothetical protein
VFWISWIMITIIIKDIPRGPFFQWINSTKRFTIDFIHIYLDIWHSLFFFSLSKVMNSSLSWDWNNHMKKLNQWQNFHLYNKKKIFFVLKIQIVLQLHLVQNMNWFKSLIIVNLFSQYNGSFSLNIQLMFIIKYLKYV